jgi:zinc and cadmium transporter
VLLLWTIGFSLLGSLGAVGGAALMLLFPEPSRRRLIPNLVSYATGTLLGAAFLGMIPTGIQAAPALHVTATILGGIVLFFLLEKLVLWRHCHAAHCEIHGQAGPLILIGDAFHNFVDGMVIAAAFLTSIPLGIAAAYAVIAHEVPQELGDFGILLDAGYRPARAFWLNALSSAATLPGAIIAYFWLADARELLPYILSLSAASFIYIAVADLMPDLHRQSTASAFLRQFVLLLAGIGTIALLRFAL